MANNKTKLSNLTGTFFKNALRSNLDLTALADSKAGILISINGFILTVSVTAAGFVMHNSMMKYAFIAIILTSLGSIVLAVMAVKPRYKKQLVEKKHLQDYESLLYYQDMADLNPKEYLVHMDEALHSLEASKEEMVTHLHILGSEIKKKYFWLKQAYTFFSIGLIISASFIIYGLLYVEKKGLYTFENNGIQYKKDKFYNIFEPSGVTTMPDGNILVVEDEKGIDSIKLLESKYNGDVVEIGNLYMPKQIRKMFKKNIEDLEAITSDANTVFMITSHSLSKSHKRKSSREKFIMFEYEDGRMTKFYVYNHLKNNLYRNFKNYFEENKLSSDDIDIEGLAFDEIHKTLLIGFASPTVDNKAVIIEIENPHEIFLEKAKPVFSKPILLDMDGLSIRDIHYDVQKKGFWIIGGSVNERGGSFELWFWDREKSLLKRIGKDINFGYIEGVTVVNSRKNGKSSLLLVEDNGLKPNKSANYFVLDKDSL